MEQFDEEDNSHGYPVFQQHPSHYGCAYAGSELVLLAQEENTEGVCLDVIWKIPNLRELCTLRADESIPALMKFAFHCGDLVFVDFVLRPKLIRNSNEPKHWLTFSARVKSQDDPHILDDMDVFLIVRGGPEDCKKSSSNGAVFRDNYSCQIPLFLISKLFDEDSDPSIVHNYNDIELIICIKLKTEDEHFEIVEQSDEHLVLEKPMFDETMEMLNDSAHGNFIITSKDTCYYVHREKVEKHPLFLNIRQLHPQEKKVTLNSWDQEELELLLFKIYSSTNDREFDRINQLRN